MKLLKVLSNVASPSWDKQALLLAHVTCCVAIFSGTLSEAMEEL